MSAAPTVTVVGTPAVSVWEAMVTTSQLPAEPMPKMLPKAVLFARLGPATFSLHLHEDRFLAVLERVEDSSARPPA